MRYDNDPLRDFCLRLANLRQQLNTRREPDRQLTEEGYDRVILEAGCTFLTSGQHLTPRRQTRQLEGCGMLGPRHPAPALFVLACDLQIDGLGGRGRCALVISVASTVGLFADTLHPARPPRARAPARALDAARRWPALARPPVGGGPAPRPRQRPDLYLRPRHRRDLQGGRHHLTRRTA